MFLKFLQNVVIFQFHTKMAKCPFYNAWDPWNVNLIKNVEDIVVFLTGKVFFLWVSPLLSMIKKCANERKTLISNSHTCSDEGFKGTVVNRALPSLPWNCAHSPFRFNTFSVWDMLILHSILVFLFKYFFSVYSLMVFQFRFVC